MRSTCGYKITHDILTHGNQEQFKSTGQSWPLLSAGSLAWWVVPNKIRCRQLQRQVHINKVEWVPTVILVWHDYQNIVCILGKVSNVFFWNSFLFVHYKVYSGFQVWSRVGSKRVTPLHCAHVSFARKTTRSEIYAHNYLFYCYYIHLVNSTDIFYYKFLLYKPHNIIR